MGSEVTGAIAGLIGAALGAGAAMWGSTTAARTQLRLNEAQLQAAITTEQTRVTRAVYADFLRAGVEFELAWRRLLVSLREGQSTAEERDRLYGEVIACEHDRWTTYSILLLEAPELVMSLARELTTAYVDLDTIGEKTRKHMSTQSWSDFNAAAEKCGALTARFTEGARTTRETAATPVVGAVPRRLGISRRARR